MKKLLSILLVLSILTSVVLCVSFSVSAENTETLAVTVDGVTTNVPVGETFKYTYSMTDVTTVCGEAAIYYDSEYVQATTVSKDDEDAYAAFVEASFPVTASATVVNFSKEDTILFNYSRTQPFRFVGEKVLVTVEFTALKAGETNIDFEMRELGKNLNDFYVDKTNAGSVIVQTYTYNEYVTYEEPQEPTEEPTEEPTDAPTEEPTVAPTEEPTDAPTEAPTEEPTEAPTEAPTEEPTAAPTEKPKAEKVENVKATTDQVTATLTWDKLDEAVKYWIYRYNDSTETWLCLGSSTTTSYVVKGLSPSTEYKFKVCYTDADYVSSSLALADEVVATTQAASDIENITGTARLVDAEITWDAVDGAVKYWLYKAWDENGPFYCYDSTTETSYIVRGLQPATDYYFKVITVTESNGYLVLSKLEDAPILHVKTEEAEKITVKLDNITTTSATISWPAFENADKYWIKYSNTTKDVNKEDQWLTYDATTETSYTFKNLKKNTTYYFTVCARYSDEYYSNIVVNYIAVDTKTLYSDENFLTFAPNGAKGVTVSWPEDVNSEKSWVYVYDKDGNEVIMNGTTTNSCSFSSVPDYKNCTYAVKTMDADSTARLITPPLGYAYQE